MLQACDDHRFTAFHWAMLAWWLAPCSVCGNYARRTKQGPIKWGQCIQVTAAEACTSWTFSCTSWTFLAISLLGSVHWKQKKIWFLQTGREDMNQIEDYWSKLNWISGHNTFSKFSKCPLLFPVALGVLPERAGACFFKCIGKLLGGLLPHFLHLVKQVRAMRQCNKIQTEYDKISPKATTKYKQYTKSAWPLIILNYLSQGNIV